MTGEPGIAAGHGGLSGPAVRPIAVAQLRAVAAVVRVPIIGMGGVANGDDAARDDRCGGDAWIAVGTENFRDPRAGEPRCKRGCRSAQEASECPCTQPRWLNLDSRLR